jgi:molybdate transport system substrate-binding protein
MRLLLGLCLLLASATGATAADVKLLTAGAFKPVAQDLIPAFEKATGHKVTLINDTAGGLSRRINAGEAFDVVILPDAAFDALAAAGTVASDSVIPLAKVGIGVAVALSAPQPDILSVEGLRRTLLAARAVAYMDPAAGATSGIYLSRLFQTMGIGSEIARKAVLVRGGLSAERVARGEADIALQQASELRIVPTVKFAGMIPAAVQNYTVYAGAIGAKAHEEDAARALLAAFSDPGVEPVLRRRGLEMP